MGVAKIVSGPQELLWAKRPVTKLFVAVWPEGYKYAKIEESHAISYSIYRLANPFSLVAQIQVTVKVSFVEVIKLENACLEISCFSLTVQEKFD